MYGIQGTADNSGEVSGLNPEYVSTSLLFLFQKTVTTFSFLKQSEPSTYQKGQQLPALYVCLKTIRAIGGTPF